MADALTRTRAGYGRGTGAGRVPDVAYLLELDDLLGTGGAARWRAAAKGKR